MEGRGRLRFELLMDQVKAALPPAPARVVDAGGGTGQVAVPLAALGYQVTVVDTSPAMLATCAERAAEVAVELVRARVPGGGGSGGRKSEAGTPAAGDRLEPSGSPPANRSPR